LPGRPAADLALDLKVAEHAVVILARTRQKMPLTAGYMQAVSQQVFGHKVGIKRAARMVAHLRRTHYLTQVSRYRGTPHGFWVPIYRLAAPVLSSVRRKVVVKGRAWWEHGLFGNPDGEKPLGYCKETRKRWKTNAWMTCESQR
jgi:hypothetical protein